MGLIFRSRRRRGMGLFGLLIVAGLCVLAVPVLLGRSGSLFTSCQNMTQSWGNTGQSLCVGLQRVFVSLHDLSGLLKGKMGGVQVASGGDGSGSSWRQRWEDMKARLDTGADWRGGQGASSMVSMDRVREMLQSGTGGYSGGATASEKLRNAFGSFMAGQSIGQSGSGDLESQLDWYRNGAGMGEYGILSQLKLGSLYADGAAGMMPDAGKAYDYNMQALGSLEMLQSSSTPEAQATLQALPMEPGQLHQQLQESLRQLQLRQ